MRIGPAQDTICDDNEASLHVMSALVIITRPSDVDDLLRWSCRFAAARKMDLRVLCWTYAPAIEYPLIDEDIDEESTKFELVVAVHQWLDDESQNVEPGTARWLSDNVTVTRILHPDPVDAVLQDIQSNDIELLIVGPGVIKRPVGNDVQSIQIVRQSPVHTILLYSGEQRSQLTDRMMVAVSNSAHDRVAVLLGCSLAKEFQGSVVIAAGEPEVDEQGKRAINEELRNLVDDVGYKVTRKIRTQVYTGDEGEQLLLEPAGRSNLVIVGIDRLADAEKFVEVSTETTLALVKRAPPLVGITRGKWRASWIPRLKPSDYSDLIHNLRQGSRWNADFYIMLGLAAGVAALGLMQSSPAVVIGSMLLAPLMTPIIGCGLSLAQANPRLGKTCYWTIFKGFVLTLFISFLLGFFFHSGPLTTELAARGNPNILDLLVALLSAAAASYAMARPSIVGAIAGVAIATALVPPLCTIGISLSAFSWYVALGATLLFVTNLVAIVIASAVTFKLMGVAFGRATPRNRLWAYRSFAAFAGIAVILVLPLAMLFQSQILAGRPQPLGYPASNRVVKRVDEMLDREYDIELMLMGRPSVEIDDFDYYVYVTAPRPVSRELADRLQQLIRETIGNPDARVKVFCLRESWRESRGTSTTE